MAKYNPFNPNSVVIPRLFAGRSNQIDEICKKLHQIKYNMPASFFIYGERGIGKTALAKLIKTISCLKDTNLHELNLISSYYSVENGQSIESVLQESVNKLTDQVDITVVEKIGKRLGGIFKNGKFEIGAFGTSISMSGMNEEERKKQEITIKDQMVSILMNFIKNISEENEDINKDKKDGILIIIDEVHNLSNIKSAASVLRNIVTTLDVEENGKIAFMLIGYKEDLEEFFKGDLSARRTFDPVKLDVMPLKEACEVLSKGFNEIEVSYNAEILQNNINVTGGYPHSIQLLGHQLIENDTNNDIQEDDWDKAIFGTAYDLRTKEFATMYSFNKALTKKDSILIALANQSESMSKKELKEKLKPLNIYQYIPELKKSGAIKEDENKNISLHSELFKTAIRIDQILRKNKKEK